LKTKFAACILCTAVLAGLLSGCAQTTETGASPASAAASAVEETPAPAQVQSQGKSYYSYFDTVSYVYSFAGDTTETFNERSAGAAEVLSRYHQLFDIYHEYSGVNNLCTINKNAGGEPVEVDEELVAFLLYAKELYTLTDGETNVMLGAVLRIWHEVRETASSSQDKVVLPTDEELLAAAEHTGIELLEIDEAAHTVRISDPEASLDVGALGKGYAVEKAAQWLRDAGAESYVLNVGGNIRTIGTKVDGTGWVTAIRNPIEDSEKNYILKIRISDTACVTSGVYERYFTVNGVRYHHIIDRDTLQPAAYYSSLTVITPDSGLADALSTALFCVPYEEGYALAASLEGVEVIWAFPDGSVSYTPGVEKLICEET